MTVSGKGQGFEDTFIVSLSHTAPPYVISGAVDDHTVIDINDNEGSVIVYPPASALFDEPSNNNPMTISLSNRSEAPVVLSYVDTPNSAGIGTDYALDPAPGLDVLNIPAGNLDFTLDVDIPDGPSTGNQYVRLDFTNNSSPTPFTVFGGGTTIFINDNDGGGGDVYVLDAVAVEGDQLQFTVTWTGPLSGGGATVSLNLFTGTATAGDFVNSTSPGNFFINSGLKSTAGSVMFTVQVNTDGLSEPNEYMSVQLSCSGGGGPCNPFTTANRPIATGTILDQPTIEFQTFGAMPIAEGGTGTFAIVRSTNGAPLARPVSFQLDNYSGTAVLGTDYQLPANSNYEIPMGAMGVTIPITFIDNDLFEFDESFTLSLTNISGGQFGGLTVMTITIANDDPLDVEPQFPVNGRNWNDYVRRDKGQAHWFDSADLACDPSSDDGVGGYSNCIHGGESKVMRTGIDSCADLKVSDEKEAFTWHCDTSATGYADFYTFELNDGIGLADLIQGGATPYLSSLTVSIVGSQPQDYGIASIGARWSNPVIQITQKGTPNQECEDFDVEGGIYYINTQINCMGAIKEDKVAVVTGKSGQLRYPSSAPKSCETGSVNEWCMLSGDGEDFLWVEANVESALNRSGPPNTVNRSGSGIEIERSKFTVIRNSFATGARYNNLRLIDVRNSKIVHSRFSDQAVNNSQAGNVFLDASEYLLFESLNINNSREAGINVRNTSYENIFNKIQLAGSSNHGVVLNGSGNARNTFKDLTVINTFEWGVIFNSGDDNSLVNGMIANTGDVGVGIINGSNNNQLANLSIYRIEGGSSGTEDKIYINSSNNNAFYGEIKYDSSTGACLVNGGSSGNEIDSSCDPANGGSFGKVDSLDLSTSFIGKVTLDSPNPEVGASFDTIAYDQIDLVGGWSSFENDLRAWGTDDLYTSTFSQSRCGQGSNSDPCRLNDWNLSDTDTELKLTSATISGGAACPADFSGTNGDAAKIFTDGMTSPNTFFVEAEEISGDGVGDDDGLCESDERCVQIFNVGADQDEETRELGEACTFSDGTLSGVELLSLVENDVFDAITIAAVWSPLSEGDSRATTSGTGSGNVRGATPKTSGKYYFEFEVVNSGAQLRVGLGNSGMATNELLGSPSNSIGLYSNGTLYFEGSNSSGYYSGSINGGDIIGFAVDLDNNRLWISVNGMWYNGATWSNTSYDPAQFISFTGGAPMVPMLYNSFATGVSVRYLSRPDQIDLSNVPGGFTPGWTK